MTNSKERVREIQQITGLRPTHFADLIRVAQNKGFSLMNFLK